MIMIMMMMVMMMMADFSLDEQSAEVHQRCKLSLDPKSMPTETILHEDDSKHLEQNDVCQAAGPNDWGNNSKDNKIVRL